VGRRLLELSAASLSRKLDYPDFPEFAQYGIEMSFLSKSLIYTLQSIRSSSQIPIIPSPVEGGWYRHDGNEDSRHYVGPKECIVRLSDAGDVFAARGRVLECWLRFQESKSVRGLGVYSDTNGPDGKLWPMIHFDLRPSSSRLFWARENREDYHYLHSDPGNFFRVIGKIIEMEKRHASV